MYWVQAFSWGDTAHIHNMPLLGPQQTKVMTATNSKFADQWIFNEVTIQSLGKVTKCYAKHLSRCSKKKKKTSCFIRALSCNPIWVAKPASCNPRALCATCKTVHRSGTPVFVTAQLFGAPPRAAVDGCCKPEELLGEPSEFSLSQTQEPPSSS